MKYKENKKNGFTLVELLAVIVILAIILVIAVPKVMSIIEDAKMGTLESTAKMIASQAEKQKVQNTVLGNNKEITCDSVAKINKGDYASCSIKFEDNTAMVTIEGSGKFDGLWVCDGTKTNAVAIKGSSCELVMQSIEVKHPLFLKGQELTPDKFEVTATYSDGSTRILDNGTRLAIDETAEATIITSPNWPENYTDAMTEEENYWEQTYEGAKAIQITFDETSKLAISDGCDTINIYDKNKMLYNFCTTEFAGNSYIVYGDYIKVTMETWYYSPFDSKGFSAIIKPMYYVNSEFTINPTVAPNIEEEFDITINVNDENISKKIITKINKYNITDYVDAHKGFDAVEILATHNGTTYNAGVRYVGTLENVKNKVYYNCDDNDMNGVAYGEDNYDYTGSCEVWRIIGVFDTKSSTGGALEKRVKLINTVSTFTASWDSSEFYYDDNWREAGINVGNGINQWGQSTYEDGTYYEGADLMRLLNGYYIGKENSTCLYCDGNGQQVCSHICTEESLKIANMKKLTGTAKNMIENAVWDIYSVKNSNTAYLEEKGILSRNNGKICSQPYDDEDYYWNHCNDNVVRTTGWTGLVGLMSVSDVIYANGWMYNEIVGWTITPYADNNVAYYVYGAYSNDVFSSPANSEKTILPSVYLKPNIKIIGGNGDTEPYKLAL